jgi:hypothetical protein
MKKFSNNEYVEKKYAGNQIIKNELYEMISTVLKTNNKEYYINNYNEIVESIEKIVNVELVKEEINYYKNNILNMKTFKQFNERYDENYDDDRYKNMYVVYIGNDKHSAWDEEEDALNQIRVLEENGYKNCYHNYEGVSEFVENGHYFV